MLGLGLREMITQLAKRCVFFVKNHLGFKFSQVMVFTTSVFVVQFTETPKLTAQL